MNTFGRRTLAEATFATAQANSFASDKCRDRDENRRGDWRNDRDRNRDNHRYDNRDQRRGQRPNGNYGYGNGNYGNGGGYSYGGKGGNYGYENGGNRGQSFTGRVTNVKSNDEFDIRISNTIYNVYTDGRAPRRLNVGDTVRVYGQRVGKNDIRNASASLLNNSNR